MINKENAKPVALVTGAGRRLGRQIAISLAKNGFDIVINYNDSKAGAQQTEALIKDLGKMAISLKADVTDYSQVNIMFQKAIKHFKKIDLLVNNSSIFSYSPLSKTTEKKWKEVLDLNLSGVFYCSKFASQYMMKAKSGRIINIASLGGIQAWHNHLPYSVSKAGVIMLTKCLAKALSPHIMVNAIAPGTIIIPGEESSKLEHVPIKTIPLKRYGVPSDIANLVFFLAQTSNYITGQIFAVDGGRSI